MAVQGDTPYDEVEDTDLALSIEQVEYSTDQVASGETPDVGDPIYWDADDEEFTETATGNWYAGKCSRDVGSDGVMWFILSAQPAVVSA